MKRFYRYKLGEYLGDVYHLTVAGESNINDVEYGDVEETSVKD